MLIAVMAIIVLAGGIAMYSHNEKKSSTGNTAEIKEGAVDNGDVLTEAMPSKTEFTEEEKERMESQTGVTITDEGVMQIDLEEILAEESSVTVSREEAKQLVSERLGEGTEIGAVDIREYQGVKYWAVHASKGGEAYQIWLNTDTGEEFINQTE